MGFKFSNIDGVFTVESPEGKLMGTNSGVVLILEHKTFILTADTFSCSFKGDEIESIGGIDTPDTDKGFFDSIITLFPK